MKILFTICGRKGSKGIKNKNISYFAGYPLLYYTLSAIDLFQKAHTEYEMDTVISSDSLELLAMAEKNPFFPVNSLIRDDALSGDFVPKPSVILDCMRKMQERKRLSYDIVSDLDLTAPLRRVSDMERLILKHIRTGPDVTLSVTDSRRNPYFNMVRETERGVKKVLESDFTARQQAPVMFDLNASLYAYKPEFLINNKGVLDGYTECIKMYDTGVLDLDHETDFELMQVIAGYLYEQKPDFGAIRQNIVNAMAGAGAERCDYYESNFHE